MKYAAIAAVTLYALLVRLLGLGDSPLWVDEASYAMGVGALGQEYVPQAISSMLGTQSELALRVPFAVLGAMTVPALWFVGGRGRKALLLAAVLASFPLFVAWSRTARPYPVAGFFMVLGWAWRPAQFLALLSTPFAVVGTRWGSWWFNALIVAVTLFMLWRPDVARGYDLWGLSRMYYLPLVAGMLYLLDRCGRDNCAAPCVAAPGGRLTVVRPGDSKVRLARDSR